MKSFIPAQATVSPKLVLKAMRGQPRQAAGEILFFSRARFALGEVLSSQAREGKTVHVPSYICNDYVYLPPEHEPSVVYHPVSSNLEPDWEWLSQNTHPGDSLLLVHYFGVPNALEKALGFCREHELVLIEDCAHSFLTSWKGQNIGCLGDYGVYSYHKLLPLRDGAGLVSRRREQSYSSSDTNVSHGQSSIRPWLWQLLKYGVFRLSLPLARLETGASDDQAREIQLARTPSVDRRMTELSYRVMRVLETEFSAIVATRRRNYLTLARAFAEFPEICLPYPELGEGVCPQAFPILVPERDDVLHLLERDGIQARLWPYLPVAIERNPRFPMANRLRDHMLLLPVHQDLGTGHMERLIKAYRRTRSA